MKNRLQEIRWEKKLSQEQLAIKSGVDKTIINYLEQDTNNITNSRNASKLANALKVHLSELFPD